MNDSQQWRRKLPYHNPLSRPRTSLSVEFDLSQKDELSDAGETLPILSLTNSMPNLKVNNKRPSLVARASQYLLTSSNVGKPRNLPPDYAENLEKPTNLSYVDLDQVVWSLSRAVLSDVTKPLGIEHNGSLMRMFEGWMDLKVERNRLEDELAAAKILGIETQRILHETKKKRRSDELLYKAEIKRLEILIAKGKTGLNQVTLARQQSLIQGKNGRRFAKKHSDSLGSASVTSTPSTTSPPTKVNLPAARLLRPDTPSRMMSALSHEVQTQPCYDCFDSIPEPRAIPEVASTLATVEISDHWGNFEEAVILAPSSLPAISDFSSFSSTGGDLLDNEIDQLELDKQAVEHIAKLIAPVHELPIEDTVAFLQACIAGNAIINRPDGLTPRPPKKCSLPRSSSSSDEQSVFSVEVNIAGPAEKIIPDSKDETLPLPPPYWRRPFSFCAGDDESALMHGHAKPLDRPGWPEAVQKAVYMTASTPSLQKRGSLIPSPMADHVLAKPRREDSTSSIITSLHCSPSGDPRETSIGASSQAETSICGESSDRGASKLGKTPSFAGSMRTAIASARNSSSMNLLENVESVNCKRIAALARDVVLMTDTGLTDKTNKIEIVDRKGKPEKEKEEPKEVL